MIAVDREVGQGNPQSGGVPLRTAVVVSFSSPDARKRGTMEGFMPKRRYMISIACACQIKVMLVRYQRRVPQEKGYWETRQVYPLH